MNIMDLLNGAGGDKLISSVSSQLNIDKNTANNAVLTALPLILAGMKKNAESSKGAESLNNALETKHDGSILDNLVNLNSNTQELEKDGNGILGHIFGEKLNVINKEVSTKTGLDSANTKKLMAILAPIAMGMLGKQKRKSNTGAGGIEDLLGGLLTGVSAPKGKAKKGGLGGMLSSFIDKDHDGNILDDLADMLK